MTGNTKTRQGLTGGSQEVLFAGGGEDQPSVARPFLLVTRGRTEYGVRCPNCRDMHRHIHLGKVTAPCGATYRVQPKRGRAAA
jgi:hypothetical protein